MIFQNGQHFRNDVVRPIRAEFRLVLIHECLGCEEVGIHQAGEKEAKHEGHGIIAGIRAGERRTRQSQIERDTAGLRVGKPVWDFLLCALAEKEATAIGEASVMSGDEIRNERTEGLAYSCVASTRGGVIYRKWRPFKSFLKLWGKLPEIMPESGEIAPVPGRLPLGGLRVEHFRRELSGPPGDLVEVAVVGVPILAFPAGIALALILCLTERGE